MVSIIRIIKDGKVIEESENVQKIGEKLIIHDKAVKEIVISILKYKHEQ